MKVRPRELAAGQRCQVWIQDARLGANDLILETTELPLEAPNWTLQGDALIMNGAGTLWRLPVAAPALQSIAIDGVPPFNNDHVLDPDDAHIYLSTYDDWHIYRASLTGGTAELITGKEGPSGMLHFLHGVSPDGHQLAFLGVQAEMTETSFKFLSAEICTIGADGHGFNQITSGGAPADGPEYSPRWHERQGRRHQPNHPSGRRRPRPQRPCWPHEKQQASKDRRNAHGGSPNTDHGFERFQTVSVECRSRLIAGCDSAGVSAPSPLGMVPSWPHLYAGGAQRGISLATGFFTGESKRNPPGGN